MRTTVLLLSLGTKHARQTASIHGRSADPFALLCFFLALLTAPASAKPPLPDIFFPRAQVGSWEVFGHSGFIRRNSPACVAAYVMPETRISLVWAQDDLSTMSLLVTQSKWALKSHPNVEPGEVLAVLGFQRPKVGNFFEPILYTGQAIDEETLLVSTMAFADLEEGFFRSRDADWLTVNTVEFNNGVMSETSMKVSASLTGFKAVLAKLNACSRRFKQFGWTG